MYIYIYVYIVNLYIYIYIYIIYISICIYKYIYNYIYMYIYGAYFVRGILGLQHRVVKLVCRKHLYCFIFDLRHLPGKFSLLSSLIYIMKA